MNYHVLITENGTEKIIIIDSYQKQNAESEVLQAVSQHIATLDNPHQTSLQQVVSKQGTTPVIGEIQIGSTNFNDELLRILKSMIVVALQGDLRTTSFDVNGFHHTTQNGYYLDMDNGGVRLYGGNNTITVNYDGTITGLLDSSLANSAVTRGYVESLAMGLKPHAPVKVMLEKGTDINTFIASGTRVGKTLTAVQNGVFQYQGVYFGQGDRIGLKCFGYQRVDAGIYVLTHVGDANSPWILTRSDDFDGSSSFESKQADVLFVQEGTYAKCMFIETQKGSEPNTGNLIIDTDLVTWELFHKLQDYVFEQGLQLLGQNVSVKPDTTTGETIIPVSVSSAGVGVQRSIITAIAEAKKLEANTYTDQQKIVAVTESKAYSDSAIQGVNQQITTLAASIPTGSSKPMIYPQFFLLNGSTIQNYSDYLYMDNAYRSGNDGGLNSNNCIPFLVPEAATLVGVSIYIGAVAVAGNYVANTNASVIFEIRQMVAGGTNTICPFSINVNGASGQIGSYGNFSATPQAFAGGIAGLSVALTKSYLLGIKFINNTTSSPIIASSIKNVVIKLEIRVG